MKKYFKTLFPPDEILGIDIGNYAIKFVLFSKDGEKIELKNWGYVPISINENMDPAEKKAIISSEISNFVKKNGIKTKYAATSLSGNSVIVRFIKVPKMSKKELDTRIATEAEAFIPFNINDVYLSYYILNENIVEEGQNKMEIVLVACKKEIVDERIEIINSSDLIPVLIDIDSFALETLINKVVPPPKNEFSSIMLLNIGQRVTNLSILVNNLNLVDSNRKHTPGYYSKLVRDIFISGLSIDKALSKKLNADMKNVDEFKKTAKILIDDEEKLSAIQNYDKFLILSSKAITDVLKDIINDVNRSIDFFISSGVESSITKIYICGGISSIPNLSKFIASELKIEVEHLNPFSFLKEVPANIPPYVLNSLCVASGLSLRKIEDL
jgi:type IV pilus assembly protein PilM